MPVFGNSFTLPFQHPRRGGAVGPTAPIKGLILTQDVKVWALFESNALTGYTNEQAVGLSMSLEL